VIVRLVFKQAMLGTPEATLRIQTTIRAESTLVLRRWTGKKTFGGTNNYLLTRKTVDGDTHCAACSHSTLLHVT
jgi:hypothetical protein